MYYSGTSQLQTHWGNEGVRKSEVSTNTSKHKLIC